MIDDRKLSKVTGAHYCKLVVFIDPPDACAASCSLIIGRFEWAVTSHRGRLIHVTKKKMSMFSSFQRFFFRKRTR